MTGILSFARAAGRRGSPRERGAAIVEFAVVSPFLIAILLGIMEYGWVFMNRLSLQNAAREGCRLATLSSTVDPYTNVTDRIDLLVATTGLPEKECWASAVEMTHATAADPNETITIRVPYTEVSLFAGFFGPSDFDLVASCSMRKEGMAAAEGEYP